jgi:hypothetical protein
MKKVGLVLLVLVILGGYMVKDSEAGQWCFQLDGFAEYVKLNVTRPDPLLPYWTLNGVWYHSSFHFIAPVSGTMVKSPDGTQRLLGISGTFIDAGVFNEVYQAQAIIDSATKNGTLYIWYDTSNTSSNFPFTKVNCGTVPPPAP